MIKARIEDGRGSGNEARVIDEGLLVSTYTSPPLLEQKTKVFRQYLTDDGTATGTSSMLIAAVATPTTFYVPADTANDRYITTLSFVIADAGASFSKFGAIAALATGCELFYETSKERVIVHGALRTNWDFVRLALGNPAFGTGGDGFKAKDVEGKTDAYIPILDLTKLMPPFGIKLDAGTTQRIGLTVSDQTDTIDSFNCIVYGFERIP
jgi:hypothetical protein